MPRNFRRLCALSFALAVIFSGDASAADELPLQEGIRLERRLFHMLTATED